MCESVLVFTMPFLCVDSGSWRRMSRGLTSNVRDNDIIMLHVSESPGVNMGSC